MLIPSSAEWPLRCAAEESEVGPGKLREAGEYVRECRIRSPNQRARVAPYWSTEEAGIQRPEVSASSGPVRKGSDRCRTSRRARTARRPAPGDGCPTRGRCPPPNWAGRCGAEIGQRECRDLARNAQLHRRLVESAQRGRKLSEQRGERIALVRTCRIRRERHRTPGGGPPVCPRASIILATCRSCCEMELVWPAKNGCAADEVEARIG